MFRCTSPSPRDDDVDAALLEARAIGFADGVGHHRVQGVQRREGRGRGAAELGRVEEHDHPDSNIIKLHHFQFWILELLDFQVNDLARRLLTVEQALRERPAVPPAGSTQTRTAKDAGRG